MNQRKYDDVHWTQRAHDESSSNEESLFPIGNTEYQETVHELSFVSVSNLQNANEYDLLHCTRHVSYCTRFIMEYFNRETPTHQFYVIRESNDGLFTIYFAECSVCCRLFSMSAHRHIAAVITSNWKLNHRKFVCIFKDFGIVFTLSILFPPELEKTLLYAPMKFSSKHSPHVDELAADFMLTNSKYKITNKHYPKAIWIHFMVYRYK